MSQVRPAGGIRFERAVRGGRGVSRCRNGLDIVLRVGSISDARLDAMVAEASVDCCNDDEQVTGLFTMIEQNLEVPFETLVLGVGVTVERVELTVGGEVVAICRRGGVRQSVPALDLRLPTPPSQGAEWIEAFRHWSRRGL